MSEATSPGLIPVDTQHGDDVDTRAIVTWGLVCVFITIITIGALHYLYTMFMKEQRQEKLYDAPYKAAASALDQQAGALEQPIRYLDQQGKTVGVPIDKAMDLVLDHYKQAN